MTGTGAQLHAGVHRSSAARRALLGWLGAWPQNNVLRVAPSARRMVSTAGQAPDVLAGVVGDARNGHGTVISVPPLAFADVRSAVDACTRTGRLTGLDELLFRLPASVGRPGAAVSTTPLRWTLSPDPSGRRLPVLLGTDDPTTATAGDVAGFPDHGWSRLALSSPSADTPTHKESP